MALLIVIPQTAQWVATLFHPRISFTKKTSKLWNKLQVRPNLAKNITLSTLLSHINNTPFHYATLLQIPVFYSEHQKEFLISHFANECQRIELCELHHQNLDARKKPNLKSLLTSIQRMWLTHSPYITHTLIIIII